MYKENEIVEIERKDMTRNEDIKYEDYLNLAYRITGYSEDVIEEYFKIAKIKNPGILTINKIYNVKVMEQLFFIQRGIKIKKLLNRIR
jgi:ferredoxin-fold anticodon binding domain-containing protein